MKVTVLCVLAVFYFYSVDQASGIIGSRRRSTITRRTRLTSTRRRTTRYTSYSTCSQKYTCSLKYMVNDTVYNTNDAYLPVEATKFNLCRTGGTWCTYYKNCRSRYLANGRTLTNNLDAWTATHWGNITMQPKPESVVVCDNAPGGQIQKGTILTIFTCITLGLATGLCFLPR